MSKFLNILLTAIKFSFNFRERKKKINWVIGEAWIYLVLFRFKVNRTNEKHKVWLFSGYFNKSKTKVLT